MEALNRVLVVDDEPLVAAGLASVIETMAEAEVADRVHDVDQAAARAAELYPDVICCDIMFGDEPDGLRILELLPAELRERVLFVSSHENPSLFNIAFAGGAGGYLPKRSRPEQLAEAIRSVAGGQPAWPAAALRSMRSALRRPTPREQQIIERLADGRSNAEIASDLGSSQRTVESQLRRLFNRYGVMSRTELTMLALREGWISPPK